MRSVRLKADPTTAGCSSPAVAASGSTFLVGSGSPSLAGSDSLPLVRSDSLFLVGSGSLFIVGSGFSRTFAMLCVALLLMWAHPADAGQLGSMLSPGALARAHTQLEGAQCQQCHEAGRKVSAPRCLSCHKPVAERIAAKKGVHRTAVDCVQCHKEHAGLTGDLRHIDTRSFNHALEAGYPLDGQHTKVASNCVACHKARTFLDARTTCASCHADPHKGTLGKDCATCHSTAVAFKAARTQFDHAKARFTLTGAHVKVACEQCHRNGVFKGLQFSACTACHKEPHEARFSQTCTSCHTTATWKTQTVQHARTRFPLVGSHVKVACARCHTGGTTTEAVRFDTCSACHVNVHRESIKDDCRACHDETTFQKGTFDHAARTRFALKGRHDGLACAKCHTSVSTGDVPLARVVADFSGARTECVSCHLDRDPHKGTFGRACDACHTVTTFSVKDFRHPNDPAFFAGQHEPVACEKCHNADTAERPAPATLPVFDCVSCHRDPHLGQLASSCDQCHRVDGAKFAAVAFSHERARLPLTGKHETTSCTKCHASETRAFPTHSGTAVTYKPLPLECRSCHQDPHFGQVDQKCETCHTTTTFTVGNTFQHQGMDDFFRGFHGRYACVDCHKKERRQYPAGVGIAVRFAVGRTCAACHPNM